MEYLATIGGIGSNVETQKLILDKLKHWRSTKHKGTPNSCIFFYIDFKTLYNQHNYSLDHIWNFDETKIQTSKQYGTKVLARRGSNVAINCAIKTTRSGLPGFYIRRGKSLRDDYIKLYKPSTCMAMQKKAWIIAFLFKEFLSFFKRSIPNGCHSLIDTC
jgi:hypothetical protein